MISSPTGNMKSNNYTDLGDEGTQESLFNKDEIFSSPCLKMCLNILESEFASPQKAEEELINVMETIDESYKDVTALSSRYNHPETTMARYDQSRFEFSLNKLYKDIFTRDNTEDSFAKLWFSRNFTMTENRQKVEFVDSFCSLIKSAENLYSSKPPSRDKYLTVVPEKEFQESYLNLVRSLSHYNDESISPENEKKITDNLKKMYFLFFPDTNQREYTNWISKNLTGTSEKKMDFAIQVIDKCKQAKSDAEKMISIKTEGFSGEKFSKLATFLCEELSNINGNMIDSDTSEYILYSLLENSIPNSDFLNCNKSPNHPKVNGLQNLLSTHIGKLYKNQYDRIGKNEVAALISALANSTGEIHHSNEAENFVKRISERFDIEAYTLDDISGRNFSEEASLFLYSQIPSSIRKMMINILSEQSQGKYTIKNLEESLNLAMDGKDEFSAIIRDNVNKSYQYSDELSGLFCRNIISSLKTKSIGAEDRNSVTATRLTSDKLKALMEFIVSNGELKPENPLFQSSKELISEITFDLSLLSPVHAHKISSILTNLEHPQAEDAKSIANLITEESLSRVAYMSLHSIKEKLLSSTTNEEKFKNWESVSRNMQIEMSHITEEENGIEKIITIIYEKLSTQEREGIKKILSDISKAEKTLSHMEEHSRSFLLKEVRTSLDLWKKSFGISSDARSKLLRNLEKPQSKWQKIICDHLNLYHHRKYNYFYQVDGTLPQSTFMVAKNKCLPNVSNGSQHPINVDGKEYMIPEALWLDANRSTFIVQDKTIMTDGDDGNQISRDELALNKTTAIIREINKLYLTDEALASLLALMNQNTAAQLVLAIRPTSISMFPKESGISSSPSLSKETIYSAKKTQEGYLILTCSISGEIKALEKLPEGISKETDDRNYSSDTDIIPLHDQQLPNLSANMKVRINEDGTVDLLDIRHILTAITPDVIDGLIVSSKNQDM